MKSARLWTGPAGSEPTEIEWGKIRAQADRMNDQAVRHRSEATATPPVDGDQATRPAMKGSVYFIYGSGRIKIGFATSPNVRLGHLQAASPEQLEPLALIPGSPDVEHFIQFMFRKHHHRDEWFEDVSEIRSFIRDHATPWSAMRQRSKRQPGWSKPLAHNHDEVAA